MDAPLQAGPGLRSRLLRRYTHGPLVWCVRGLSGCHWGPEERSPAPGDCGCNKVEGLGVALLTVAFFVTLVFLYFWGQAKNDYNDFDWFTFEALGFWFHWSVLLLVVIAVLFSYIAALMVVVALVLLFSLGGLSALSELWSGEWKTLLLSFQITAPFLHVGGLLLMTALSWPVAVFVSQTTSSVCRAVVLVLFLLLLSALYLLPLGLYSPCIQDRSRLGPPPALIGHRGAPMTDPFHTAGSLSQQEMQQAQQQSVPSLLDLLHLASGSGSMVLFDLHRPPPAHPHRDTWIQRTLDVVLNQSDIPPSQVLWLPSDLRDQVQELEPDLQQTSGSQRPLEDLQRNNIVRLNLHYSHVSASMVRQYALLNISVNLYVVSEPWLFSVAWCSGVQSVTSNCPHTLRDMRRPLLLMSPVQYQTLWTLSDLVSLLLVLLLFCFHWWRERSLSLISAHRALDTGTYISTELCEVWSVSSANAEDSL